MEVEKEDGQSYEDWPSILPFGNIWRSGDLAVAFAGDLRALGLLETRGRAVARRAADVFRQLATLGVIGIVGLTAVRTGLGRVGRRAGEVERLDRFQKGRGLRQLVGAIDLRNGLDALGHLAEGFSQEARVEIFELQTEVLAQKHIDSVCGKLGHLDDAAVAGRRALEERVQKVVICIDRFATVVRDISARDQHRLCENAACEHVGVRKNTDRSDNCENCRVSFVKGFHPIPP